MGGRRTPGCTDVEERPGEAGAQGEGNLVKGKLTVN